MARGLLDDEADLLQREIDAAEATLSLDSGTEQTLVEELRLIQWFWPDGGAAWRNAAWRRVVARIVIVGPEIRVE